MPMCLRSVHSLHLHFVQPFRSFRCTSFSTLSFTTFRFRSFHPPQHRIQEQLLQSSKECKRYVSFRYSVDTSTRTGKRNLHQHEQLHFTPSNSLLSISRFTCLCPRTFFQWYSLFFSATCLSLPPHEYSLMNRFYWMIEILKTKKKNGIFVYDFSQWNENDLFSEIKK